MLKEKVSNLKKKINNKIESISSKKCKKRNANYLLLIFRLIILVSLICLLFSFFYIHNTLSFKDSSLKDFYREQEIIKENNIVDNNINNEELPVILSNDYVASLKIDKINLDKGLYDMDSPLNDVNNNIQIIKGSSMPDVEQGNLILASHNGNTNVSFFRNLYKLEPGDEVIIFYNGYQYLYQVINSYKVNKTGTVNIIRNKEKTTLTLITCSGENQQLVVICELVNKI